MFPKFFDMDSVSDMGSDLYFEENEQRRKQIANRDINIFRSYEETMYERRVHFLSFRAFLFFFQIHQWN